MDSKILKELKKVLNMFGDKYIKEEVLNKSVVLQDIKNYNEELVEELLNNSTIKKHYTKNINNHIVIEIDKLMQTFEMDTPWMNSATNYSKKIGLTTNNKFITENQDVVLDFPYKDTVLKAGMTKEDVAENETVNEPFYNEIMDAEEIDRLLDPKIFVQTKRYTQNGVEENIEFNDDDNLVIKGNNLLALHTLKERYAGKVKLIYIDPPYNTGNDSFQYNDKFNHSTWLTFMKNRLEIAKKLLRDDGSILVQCDDNEHAYLQVLMNDIFGRDNFITNFIWEKKTGSSDANHIANITEYILLYAKNLNSIDLNKNHESFDKNRYKYKDEYFEERGYFYYDTLDRGGLRYSDSLNYGVEDPDGNIHYPNGRNKFENDGWTWKWSKSKVEWGLKNGFCEFVEQNDGYRLKYKTYLKVDNEGKSIDRSAPYKNLIKGILNTHATKEIKTLFGTKKFKTPKPEELLKYLINIASDEEDIILDFFMGSATTQAVAHKMNRKYIGIEQMDYIEDVSVERLKKVIDGEQGGISEEVNWQGGGSFVYAELMPKSMGYLKTVLTAKSIKELKDVYKLMIDNVATDFRVDLEAVREELTNNEIKLEDKKQLLAKIIDKNGLYYNYSEINDKNVRDFINSSDYQFNQSFYSKED